jgi:hypothetical protein
VMLDKLYQLLRFKDLNQVDTYDVPSMVNKLISVILLSLENIYEILFCFNQFCDVQHGVLSFSLMIWWIWDFKLSLTGSVVYLYKPIFRKAVLETKTIQPDASNLYFERIVSLFLDHLEELWSYAELFLTATDAPTNDLLFGHIIFEF